MQKPENILDATHNTELQITLSLPDWMIEDLKTMEKNTQKSVNELVKTSLMMFIATHNDYLGVNPHLK